ncbi:MAG: hypothetical protein FXF47_05055 [Candidatus Mcinerneyibacterium aminivorans]|uniref:DUF2269 family protein n=1 Tax=Candidatus Mcinerneyibacterium aminivorans TaxID=2703815 RepID=A0A5D0ME52_9BACT|nr:MAG: hypothetical protein FXF47_05055 [Candidatus Mcinerneyibacterium aminivorans]
MFKIVCYILSITTFVKSITGIFAHDKLYNWAKRHYSKEKRSWTTILLIVYGVGVLILTWYGTIFDYVKYGWIVTILITFSSIKLAGLIFNWKKVSKKFVKFIENSKEKLWMLDVLLLIISIGFLLMGIYLY